ncbi:MAG: NAD(P)H-dependent oxidoreductase subunit E [Candidatus Omnitrophica bacterium]|nr:NAD(P)H-dependent oxidoreductase subunit E [Candidatus Omnitrophota bacterium]
MGGSLIFTEEHSQEIWKIISRYEDKRAALLPVLHFVQEIEGLISPESEKDIAEYLEIPVVHVHDVVTFYHLFHQTRKGKCHFSVCQTTSCALRGAEEMIDHLKKRLQIKPGETTADGKFSLTVVECLGACELAPMMQFNKEYKGHLNKKKLDELINQNQ